MGRDRLLLHAFLWACVATITQATVEFNCTIAGPVQVTVNDTAAIGYPAASSDLNITISDCPPYFEVDGIHLLLNKLLIHNCLNKFDCKVTCLNGIEKTLVITTERHYNNYTANFKRNDYNTTVAELLPPTSFPINNPLGGDITIEECETPFVPGGKQFIIQDNNSHFDINPSSGEISLISPFDYDSLPENKKTIRLPITAEIKFNPTEDALVVVASTIFTVFVEDVDDMNPAFILTDDQLYFELNITEQDRNQTGVPLASTPPVLAYDQDKGINDTIFYSILEGASGIFSINRTSGLLTVSRELNSTERQQYTVTIKAEEANNAMHTATATILVNVIDVNNNRPVFNPVEYKETIEEHSSKQTYVTTVTARDQDRGENAEFQYFLCDPSDAFSIDETTGVIQVLDPSRIDRDVQDTITIKICTKETITGDLGENNATVNVILADINDNSPVFNDTCCDFIYNATFHAQVHVYDVDAGQNANVTFRPLVDLGAVSPHFPFQIDELDGTITADGSVVSSTTYTFLIEACDNPLENSARRCSWKIGSIRNEANTTFEKNTTQETAYVAENVDIDTLVTHISKCPGEKYVLDEHELFKIDESLGLIYTKGNIDYENETAHQLMVSIKFKNQVICRVNLTVNVIDVNDNTPVFEKNSFQIHLPDNVTDGTIVGTIVPFMLYRNPFWVSARKLRHAGDDNWSVYVDNWSLCSLMVTQAKDADSGSNGNVKHILRNTTDSVAFDLTSDGQLSVSHASLLKKDYFQLLVVAIDNGIPPLETSATVVVTREKIGNFTVPVGTPLYPTDLEKQKLAFEGNLSNIMKPLAIKIENVTSSSGNYRRSIMDLSATENGRKVPADELLRLILLHWDEIQSLFYKAEPTVQAQREESGLRVTEICLIAVAGVILIGAIIAVIILTKQYKSHERYKRLYESLTRNSSIYESQEIKMNIEEETSDYNGSVNSKDLDNNGRPTSMVTASINPLFQDDDGKLTSRDTTEAMEQAMESLDRLHERLSAEEVVPKVEVNGLEEVSEQTEPKADYHEDNPGDDGGNVVPGPDASHHAYENTEILDPGDIVIGSPALQNITGDLMPDYDTHNNNINPNERSSLLENEQHISLDSPRGLDDDVFSPVATETDEKQPGTSNEEPQPDYHVKQARFSEEVLDIAENKLKPLNEKEPNNLFETQKQDKSDDGSETIIFDQTMPSFLANADDDDDDEMSSKDTTDEAGWVEEEINSPTDVMTVEGNDNPDGAFPFLEEATTAL